MTLTIVVEPHPLLDAGAFVIRLARPLGETAGSPELDALAAPGATAPVTRDEATRTAVRELLRHGGFKPSGRSKPASEYLVAAITENRFPRINPLVDACNVASLHSGLPISLVDVDLVKPPLAIRVAPAGTTYVFNPSGQVIDAGGLLAVHDADGPTGTPVKDAQRTKTHPGTRAALALLWGTRARPGHTAATTRWYRDLVATLDGATTEDVDLLAPAPTA